MATAYREARLLFAVGDGKLPPQVVARRQVFDARDVFGNRAHVVVVQAHRPARRATAERQRGLRREDPDRIRGVVLEILLHALLQAVARAQQQHEHEDAPGDARAREYRSQLVPRKEIEHLAPAIHHRSRRARL